MDDRERNRLVSPLRFHLDSEEVHEYGYQHRYNELIRRLRASRAAKEDQDALSKGMRAKVSLSLAMASGPRACSILDEPTSGLDTLVRREFLESMVDLVAAGRTVLLSSHQIGEVERVASHIAILHRGKLPCWPRPLDDLKGADVFCSRSRHLRSRDHPGAPARGKNASS